MTAETFTVIWIVIAILATLWLCSDRKAGAKKPE